MLQERKALQGALSSHRNTTEWRLPAKTTADDYFFIFLNSSISNISLSLFSSNLFLQVSPTQPNWGRGPQK
jgi:hypothetical protein